MINGQKVLAVITARGGSKGVPGKNLRKLAGRSLLGWTVAAGQGARHLDRLILSSDDDAIMAAARELGCEVPFRRPSKLATDSATSVDVALDALERCPGFDFVVLLQPTSPLRTSADIDAALERCAQLKAGACVSVCEVEQNPYWMYRLGEGEVLEPLLPGALIARRQELPRIYTLNGAVYVARVMQLRQTRSFMSATTVAYEMPRERSLDIDTEADLQLAAALLS